MSIFSRLRRYKPSSGRDPIEDFTTEAFAAILDANPDLARVFVTHLAKRSNWSEPIAPNAQVTWTTQHPCEGGIVDMIGDIEGGPVLVFEHKVWSALRENQITDYRTAMERKHPGRVRTVLITGRRGAWTQSADVQLTWAQVHDLVSNAGTGHLVEDFLGYLRSEGLGPPAPVSHESLVSWVSAQTLLPAVEALMQRLLHETDWSAHDDIFGLVTEPTKPPTYKPLKWGRVGLSFAEAWRPGFLVGVMLDGKDHLLPLVDPAKGPDYVAMIEFDPRDDGIPLWKDYVGSTEFTALRARLKSDSGQFEVWDVLDHPPKEQNPWHPLHLRRPLLEVLAGTRTADDQLARVQAATRDAVSLFLAGGELAQLRRARA